MLSDYDIRLLTAQSAEFGEQLISPVPEDHQYQPASVDLRLGDEFTTFVRPLGSPSQGRPVVVGAPMDPEWSHMKKSANFIMVPGEFVLATTIEAVHIPRTHVARVEGRSSLGRLGLIIHATAGFIDPGFRGQITLEMMNLSPRPIQLELGMRICQISFDKLINPAKRPYGHPALRSRYQGQTGVTASRLSENKGPK
jgi:dCTP deaminase